ncbi:MAG: hypothetical protein AAF840_04900 [Bacteroidota bacterium]
MRPLLFLLFALSLNSCSKENFAPAETPTEIYYLLVRYEAIEDTENLKAIITNQLRPLGNFRATHLFLGEKNDEPIITIRRFQSLKKGRKAMKELQKKPLFKERDLRVVSQQAFREILKRRSFHSVVVS